MLFWSLRTESSQQTSYDQVRALQQTIVELRAQDLVEDLTLFLEHEPVVTRGRGLQQKMQTAFSEKPGSEKSGTEESGLSLRHMPLAGLPAGVDFAESERGGDLTYHGPGQLVIYPIFKMDGKGFAPLHDVAGYLRKLEFVVMTELDRRLSSPQAKLKGARTESVPDAAGVWIRSAGETKASKKIASMGIAVRKWVSYHGIAINCVNDLDAFKLFSPCGFPSEAMTRLQDWVELPKAWRPDLESSLAHQLSIASMDGEAVQIESLTLNEAKARTDKIEADARHIAGSDLI
jgi:lipoyl(octanoyl) transferase